MFVETEHILSKKTSFDLKDVLHPTSKIGAHSKQPVLHQIVPGDSNRGHHLSDHAVRFNIDLFLHSHTIFNICYVWACLLRGLN